LMTQNNLKNEKEKTMLKQKVTSETKPCEEYLSCLLTDKELIAKSRELAKANEDLADVEAKKKDVMADFTAQQKKHEANISVLSRIVSGGKEYPSRRLRRCFRRYAVQAL